MWEKRVSKLHRRLEKIEENVNNNPDLEPRYIDDLIKLDMVRDFRKELNKGKRKINQLKAEKEQGFDTGKMIDWLENTRADEIEGFLKGLER